MTFFWYFFKMSFCIKKITIFDVSCIWNLVSNFCPNHMLIPYFCRVFVIFFEKLQNEVEQLHFPQILVFFEN